MKALRIFGVAYIVFACLVVNAWAQFGGPWNPGAKYYPSSVNILGGSAVGLSTVGATTGNFTTVNTTNANATALTASTANLTNATIPTLGATTFTTTNATATNFTATTATLTSATIPTLNSTSATIPTLTTTNATATALTATTLLSPIGVNLQIDGGTIAATVGNDKAAFSVNSLLNGYYISDVDARVTTAGVTGTLGITITKENTSGVASTAYTESVTTGLVQSSTTADTLAHRTLATGDKVRIDVTSIHSGTASLGLLVGLTLTPSGM